MHDLLQHLLQGHHQHHMRHLLQGHHQHHQCQYLSEIKENEIELEDKERDGSGVGGEAAAAAAAWVGVYSRRGSARRSVRLICATLIFFK